MKSSTELDLDYLTCTIPFRGGEVTLLCMWRNNEGSVMSYHDEKLNHRAYFDRYDKFFDSKKTYQSFVKRMLGKATMQRSMGT